MKKALFTAAALTLLVPLLWAATGPANRALAQDTQDELAAGNADAMKIDSQEYPFVRPVCTACHTPQRFLRPRPWRQWEDTWRRMQGHGAQGTPVQWDHIHTFFARNLTVVDINNDLEDEISAALGVPVDTAVAIVRDAPFANAQDLERVPGVTKEAVSKLGDRLTFQPVRKPF